MAASGIKPQARRLIDELPEESTWDDLIDAIVVRLAIEAGIRDFDEGRTVGHEEVARGIGNSA